VVEQRNTKQLASQRSRSKPRISVLHLADHVTLGFSGDGVMGLVMEGRRELCVWYVCGFVVILCCHWWASGRGEMSTELCKTPAPRARLRLHNGHMDGVDCERSRGG
jgi:hypothetical protein